MIGYIYLLGRVQLFNINMFFFTCTAQITAVYVLQLDEEFYLLQRDVCAHSQIPSFIITVNEVKCLKSLMDVTPRSNATFTAFRNSADH